MTAALRRRILNMESQWRLNQQTWQPQSLASVVVFWAWRRCNAPGLDWTEKSSLITCLLHTCLLSQQTVINFCGNALYDEGNSSWRWWRQSAKTGLRSGHCVSRVQWMKHRTAVSQLKCNLFSKWNIAALVIIWLISCSLLTSHNSHGGKIICVVWTSQPQHFASPNPLLNSVCMVKWHQPFNTAARSSQVVPVLQLNCCSVNVENMTQLKNTRNLTANSYVW